MLETGKILAQADARSLLTSPQIAAAYLGETPKAFSRRAGAATKPLTTKHCRSSGKPRNACRRRREHTCGYLAAVVIAGLLLQLIAGFWWVDAVTSLGIVWFLVKEGREASEGEECCETCG